MPQGFHYSLLLRFEHLADGTVNFKLLDQRASSDLALFQQRADQTPSRSVPTLALCLPSSVDTLSSASEYGWTRREFEKVWDPSALALALVRGPLVSIRVSKAVLAGFLRLVGLDRVLSVAMLTVSNVASSVSAWLGCVGC
jgi:hypothetical protein